MKLHEVNFKRVATAPLSADDTEVLQTIYYSRLRTFSIVFGAILIIVGMQAAPYVLYPIDGQQLSGGITGFLLCCPLPAAIIFRNKVWVYRRDCRAGYKHVVYEQVIRKQAFPFTGQFFLSLDDASYLHHEVEQAEYERIEVGDRYAVYFAAHSRYPFTLRVRVTMM